MKMKSKHYRQLEIYKPFLELYKDLSLLFDTELSEEQLLESFGRLCWSTVIEPGDSMAGVCVKYFGPAAAFQNFLTFAHDPQEIYRLLVDVDSKNLREQEHLYYSPELIHEAVDRWMKRLNTRKVEQAIHNSLVLGTKLISPAQIHWPDSLDDLGPHAPMLLWFRGDATAIRNFRSSIAIVGARASTAYGEQVTQEFTKGAVEAGLLIVSGGAYGIDGAAHRAALSAEGQTIAILAGGVDRMYPSSHEALFHNMMKNGGAILAEQPPGTTPSRWRFLLRNRLLAAISNATLVVEAGRRSGSINTAGHAAELGRPLGAVPGPITSASSLGTHYLIREYDAECIASVSHLLELANQRSYSP